MYSTRSSMYQNGQLKVRISAPEAVQKDDQKILVVGSLGDGSQSRVELGRYNADGTPDTSFGAARTGWVILPSLGAGVPVVMWRGAAEGLGLALGELEDLLVADDAAGFARRVIDLHRDAALWQAVHEGLLAAAGDRFRSATTRRGLWSALACCGLGIPSRVD